jgi:hypothetical protein
MAIRMMMAIIIMMLMMLFFLMLLVCLSDGHQHDDGHDHIHESDNAQEGNNDKGHDEVHANDDIRGHITHTMMMLALITATSMLKMMPVVGSMDIRKTIWICALSSAHSISQP